MFQYFTWEISITQMTHQRIHTRTYAYTYTNTYTYVAPVCIHILVHVFINFTSVSQIFLFQNPKRTILTRKYLIYPLDFGFWTFWDIWDCCCCCCSEPVAACRMPNDRMIGVMVWLCLVCGTGLCVWWSLFALRQSWPRFCRTDSYGTSSPDTS